MPLTRDRSNGFVGLVSMICSCFMLCLFNYCMSINSLSALSFNTPQTTLRVDHMQSMTCSSKPVNLSCQHNNQGHRNVFRVRCKYYGRNCYNLLCLASVHTAFRKVQVVHINLYDQLM
jgi:hypothetical protein